MRNPILVGRTVYLRALEPDDADSFQTWMNDQEVVRNLLIHRPLTRGDQARFMERTSATDPDDAVFAIVRKKGDLLIGSTGLHDIDWRRRVTAFGIEIGRKEEWGKGYGTEATELVVGYAFRSLNMHRVWLHVYEYNTRGIGAYKRVGFRTEATLRQETFRDGRYWDVYHMGLLRTEWLRSRKKKAS